ncbi:GNAT family N-acetyltransferase [Blastococcus deserti]|uniref:GNAT family N-acetyltransferase n=1 Tax=Blastococcus deserti TaxID=2259033 RepID=A0ABW4X975_9ACTN
MAGDLLLHLIEPAQWRAALADGAVRPPSLASVGFVHLSTPDLVHVPAKALHPVRRDLVLLVVDPARLTDRVRFEPGVPADPGGRLFPHLYGPLPVSAVVAVVPYRPPARPPLPAPDDVLGRAVAYYASLPVRRAAGVEDVPGGVAVLDPGFPHSRDNNRLVLTAPVDAATIEATADEMAADAGWPHRAAALLWAGAGEVAGELAERGWEVEELLLMARGAEPLPGGERAELVDQRDVHPLWERSWRDALPDLGPQLNAVVAQLVGREHLNDRVVAVHDVVVREDGRVVAAGQLRIDGATAAVDSVLTDPPARGRGYGDAVLARSLAVAAGAGCDLVVLEAAADDWPRHWYARRGFEAVGSSWSVSRPA